MNSLVGYLKLFAPFPAELFKKITTQLRDILFPFPQGRHLDGNDLEPVKKVLPEISLFDLIRELFTC